MEKPEILASLRKMVTEYDETITGWEATFCAQLSTYQPGWDLLPVSEGPGQACDDEEMGLFDELNSDKESNMTGLLATYIDEFRAILAEG